jgi:RNA polymerase sigma-70 factor (ECF subfamily)
MTSGSLFEREALTHLDALQHFAFQLCRDKQSSHDLVQDTMLKAIRYFHTYKEGTNCRAWLYQICKNSFINNYHRRQHEPVAVDFQELGSMGGVVPDAGHGLRSEVFDESAYHMNVGYMSDEVATALDRIPADYQTVLILSDIEGYTYEEIAGFLHSPIGTIRSRIHRGRKLLAHRLSTFARREGYHSRSRFTRRTREEVSHR